MTIDFKWLKKAYEYECKKKEILIEILNKVTGMNLTEKEIFG